MYANNGDPESLRFPHEALSFDANSVGLFQQRAPWWGTVADRMSPERSAGLFYAALARLDYNSNAHTPGWYAQAVQQSAFPTRYDARFAEAQALFDRLAGGVRVEDLPAAPAGPEFKEVDRMTGGGRSTRTRKPTLWLVHTEEGNSSAEQLARFCDGSNQVSYHYTLRDGVLCNVVDTDFASWSVLSANAFTINLCFAGSRASWSRSQWLAREGDISVAAFVAVQDCKKYGIPIAVIPPPYAPGAGVSDHKYVTQELGIGNHTDVGNDFPWDVFTNYMEKWANAQVKVVEGPQSNHAGGSVVPPTLQVGSSGAAVRTLQQRLKLAFAAFAGHLEVDGVFGPVTQGAVIEFQKRANLAADGVVGPVTAAALQI